MQANVSHLASPFWRAFVALLEALIRACMVDVSHSTTASTIRFDIHGNASMILHYVLFLVPLIQATSLQFFQNDWPIFCVSHLYRNFERTPGC